MKSGPGRRARSFRTDADVGTTCYGCGKPFTPDSHTLAGEVLCGGCRKEAEPQQVDARGLLAESDRHLRDRT